MENNDSSEQYAIYRTNWIDVYDLVLSVARENGYTIGNLQEGPFRDYKGNLRFRDTERCSGFYDSDLARGFTLAMPSRKIYVNIFFKDGRTLLLTHRDDPFTYNYELIFQNPIYRKLGAKLIRQVERLI